MKVWTKTGLLLIGMIVPLLILAGCVTPPPAPAPAPVYVPIPSNRIVPPLDSELARPCALPPFDDTDDYDAWQNYFVSVLETFAGCANRHLRVVDIYNEEVKRNAPAASPGVPAAIPAAPAPRPAWPPIRNNGG